MTDTLETTNENEKEVVKIEEETRLQKIITKSFIKNSLAVSLFSFGFNFVTTAEYVYLEDIFMSIGLNDELKTSSFLTAALIALCLGAAIGGILNDKIRSRFGQRIPSIFIGSLIGAIIILAIPFLTQLINNLDALYYLLLAAFIVSHLFLGAAYSPWLALVSDLFSKKERITACIAINIISAIGAAIAVIIFSVCIDKNISWLIWFIVGIVLLITTVITVILLPKRNPDEKPEVKYRDMIQIPKVIWKYGGITWTLLLCVNAFWSFSSHIIETSLVESLKNRFNVTALMASISSNILMGIYIVILLLPIIWLINKLRKIKAGIVTSVVYSFFCFLLALQKNFNAIYFIMIFGAIGNILLSTIQIALPADIVPKGREASFMGVFFVFGTVMKPLATLVKGLLKGFYESSTIIAIENYQSLFFLSSVICLLTIIFLTIILKKQKTQERNNLQEIRNLKEKRIEMETSQS